MSLIVGIHSVHQALQTGAGIRLLVRSGKLNARQNELVELAEAKGLPVERVDATSSELADQGVALEVNPPRPGNDRDLETLLASGEDNWLFLLLDGVTDPRNFGACLRSAASFGAHGVIVPRDNAAPLNEAAIKTASGAASLVPVFVVTNLARSMDRLKDSGIWIVGTDLAAESSLEQIDLKGKIAVVMGAEDKGMRQKTRKQCDFLAQIPAPYPDLSLNVSVATGICLYEVTRQRFAKV